MCGACGRTVIVDPVLGAVRTLRQHIIVAQTVSRACRTWPGLPRITATGAGWTVTGATGTTTLCATVEALWGEVLRGRGPRPEFGPPAAPGDAMDPDSAALAMRVLAAGQLQSAAAHP